MSSTKLSSIPEETPMSPMSPVSSNETPDPTTPKNKAPPHKNAPPKKKAPDPFRRSNWKHILPTNDRVKGDHNMSPGLVMDALARLANYKYPMTMRHDNLAWEMAMKWAGLPSETRRSRKRASILHDVFISVFPTDTSEYFGGFDQPKTIKFNNK
jgi:hypothetical protein